MPAMETSFRRQKATLWAKVGVDAYNEPTVSAPVVIKVRWVWVKKQVTDAEGNKRAIDATAVVNRDIATGSIMWLGELDDWVGTGSGGNDDELMEVVSYDETEDIKARNKRRTVTLAFYRDALPQVV